MPTPGRPLGLERHRLLARREWWHSPPVSSHREAEKASPRAYGGLLVAIEGIDGAGKTTQVRRLAAALSAQGREVLATKEPTNGKWGAKIRLSASTGRLPLEEELHAFLEDRKEHVRDELLPALQSGKVVVVDRYYLSNVAYQGARGKDPVEIFRRNAFAPVPDLLIILDVAPDVGLARVKKRGDVADLFEKEEELAKAREIFRNSELFRRYIDEVQILDATRSEDELSNAIARLVLEKWSALREQAPERGAQPR
jgi:dTMP kinase